MKLRRLTVHIAAVAAVTLLLTAPNNPSPAEAESASGAHVNAVGTPAGGTTADGSVRGFLDAHNHLFSNEAFGGKLLCGKVFDPGDEAAALVDCADHFPNGELAWFENFTRTGSPTGTHNPAGWPTFEDWPAHDSLTHQQNYYTWIERAWRGGLRVMVNHLVTNKTLCDIYPLKDRSCDEMTSIRLQARLAYDLQDFIDARSGGPGKGWFRIVLDAAQARQVVTAGKLAVVLGVETSEPFGCKHILGIAQCSAADIDRGLDELHGLGVRSMYLCHKFDNALCGVRFDGGTQGTIINVGNFVGTGQFWKANTCTGPHHDNTVAGIGELPPAFQLPPGITLPVYPPAPHCNVNGLTSLGEHAVKGMISRGMLVEIDHMSAKAADQTLDLLEAADYPGVISSHSWTDAGYFPRIYRLGGMIAQYGHAANQFVQEWQRSKPLRDQYGIVGYGVGIDANGFGGLPGPRTETGVTYPFRSFDGSVTLDRMRTGERIWDVNRDGMAHYGLLPDWIEDMRTIAGDGIVADLAGGAEAYLRTLGAAESHSRPANLALNRPATASSYEWWTFWVNLKAPKAFDGNEGTRWASEWNDNQWIQVDLGASRPIGRVVLDWETAYAAAYRIDVSDNGSAWRTVSTVDNRQGGLDVLSFTATTARYVRVQMLRRGGPHGYSLWEMEVHAP